jgi:type I restriction enzyme M protein
MAKNNGAVKNGKSFEESLWETATKLRGSVESSEYKHVVLSLIFLKFVSDKFEERRAELIAEGKEQYADMVEFYAMNNVFYLPETSRWSYIQQHAKQGDINANAWDEIFFTTRFARANFGASRRTSGNKRKRFSG